MKLSKEMPYLIEESCSSFRNDVIRGLSARAKHLEAKYFYNTEGDRLFQQIMKSPQYYLTRAEMEILSVQAGAIIEHAHSVNRKFDIVELGAGDATKSVHLLKEAMKQGSGARYFPIDISAGMINELESSLPKALPGITVTGLEGEYFPMLDRWHKEHNGAKLVLFLGATIGNMLPGEALSFCGRLRDYFEPGDLLLIGFDLKKNPVQILEAYSDSEGITRAFNLNLLKRINSELGADFDTAQFEHYATYDPGNGSCKSYLISKNEQVVTLDRGQGPSFYFTKNEPVFMEVSQKYDQAEINQMAADAGFEPIKSFYDSNGFFVDTLWKVP